ncbi:MAG: S41 family peptidase [Rikenellaceae bacterium]
MSKIGKFFVRAAVPLMVIVALALGVLLGGGYATYHSNQRYSSLLSSVMGQTSKLAATLQLIDKHYVDSIAVNDLVEELMPKLVGMLDPHSDYIPASKFQRANESLDGEFDGIGVVFNMATDTVIVLNVIPTGPSNKAGVLARDRIITIDGRNVAGEKINQDSVVKMLRGKRGTRVVVGVERGGNDELVDIEITRGKIPIHSVTAKLMLSDGVGYITLAQFSRNTYKEFVEAMNELRVQGMKSLILDLRGNSGGFMDQAIALATEFLPKNSLIVYTEDRDGKQTKEYTKRDGQLQQLPLAVLIDEGSASSSEIVAGALQDNDRGVIIGRRSFGKGLVQQQIPFADGSALRLTIARYFTPTGRSIQKPYTMGDKEGYERDIINRIEHEELYTIDSIQFVDSLRKVTPKGKVVYGGGGIMPDIFVGVDREELPEFVSKVIRDNTLYLYTIEYSDKNRYRLASVETIADLDRVLTEDRDLYTNFIKYARAKGIEVDEEQIASSEELLTARLRAHIGRNTSLGDNGFYINIYPFDDAIMRAIKELN